MKIGQHTVGCETDERAQCDWSEHCGVWVHEDTRRQGERGHIGRHCDSLMLFLWRVVMSSIRVTVIVDSDTKVG